MHAVAPLHIVRWASEREPVPPFCQADWPCSTAQALARPPTHSQGVLAASARGNRACPPKTQKTQRSTEFLLGKQGHKAGTQQQHKQQHACAAHPLVSVTAFLLTYAKSKKFVSANWPKKKQHKEAVGHGEQRLLPVGNGEKLLLPR